jgi:hypothetical protein
LKLGLGSTRRERGRVAKKGRLSQGGRTQSKEAARCHKEAAKLLQGGRRLSQGAICHFLGGREKMNVRVKGEGFLFILLGKG